MIKYKEQLVAIIKKHVPKCTVYLFGSRARGTHHPGSDIDIALDCGHKIDLSLIGKINDEIEQANIPFFVDIVDLVSTSDIMRIQILKEGIVWSD